jgi:hypothetical protein
MRVIGYNAKLITKPEPWLENAGIDVILSVSECLHGTLCVGAGT